MMDRLSNSEKLRAFELAEHLYYKHMDDIISGHFSATMMVDWENGDKDLFAWSEATGKTAFENAPKYDGKISEQEYFDNGVLM